MSQKRPQVGLELAHLFLVLVRAFVVVACVGLALGTLGMTVDGKASGASKKQAATQDAGTNQKFTEHIS